MARLLTPTMGGPQQVIKCGGERFNLHITAQPMSYAQAMGFVSALLAGLTDLIQIPFDQPNFNTAASGSPTVQGGGGTSLQITGGGPIAAGQMFTLVHAGRSYLHMATAPCGGSGLLSITPMLRVVPSAGDTLIFGQPYIEGYLDGGAQQWSVGMIANLGLDLSLTEAA